MTQPSRRARHAEYAAADAATTGSLGGRQPSQEAGPARSLPRVEALLVTIESRELTSAAWSREMKAPGLPSRDCAAVVQQPFIIKATSASQRCSAGRVDHADGVAVQVV